MSDKTITNDTLVNVSEINIEGIATANTLNVLDSLTVAGSLNIDTITASDAAVTNNINTSTLTTTGTATVNRLEFSTLVSGPTLNATTNISAPTVTVANNIDAGTITVSGRQMLVGNENNTSGGSTAAGIRIAGSDNSPPVITDVGMYHKANVGLAIYSEGGIDIETDGTNVAISIDESKRILFERSLLTNLPTFSKRSITNVNVGDPYNLTASEIVNTDIFRLTFSDPSFNMPTRVSIEKYLSTYLDSSEITDARFSFLVFNISAADDLQLNENTDISPFGSPTSILVKPGKVAKITVRMSLSQARFWDESNNS